MAGEKLLMGLDIGSSRVRCVIGSVDRDGNLSAESLCERPSTGVRSGLIDNIEQAMKCIGSVINESELQAGAELSEAVIGQGGEDIVCVPSNGIASIRGNGQEIRREDVMKSLEVARSIALPEDREIIHTLVQDFEIDGQSGIKDPIDMLGHRLETRVLIVTASATLCQNKRKCIMRSGLNVRRIVMQSLADAEAVLSPEEKELGCILIDVGSGTSNLIAYSHGAPVWSAGINEGGDLVTNDLAMILNRPLQMAEAIKKESGYSYVPGLSGDEMVTIPATQGMPAIMMPKREIARIVEARMAEIFTRLQATLVKSGIRGTYGSGLVLVGGGARLAGAADLAGEIFGLHSRVGVPLPIQGLDRSFLTPDMVPVLGLLRYEAKKFAEQGQMKKRHEGAQGRSRNSMGGKIKGFFRTLF